jgi:hypothetical protein
MIRPVTLVCWILALSAGLYLYRAKHEVELMDQHIDRIAKQTADLRGESRGLLDEWIRLGEPEQLHRYSDEYLGLQPISPAQFARLSDLAARLPATQPDPPAEAANVAAQTSGGAAAGASLHDEQSSALGSVVPVDALATEPEIQASADDIPVPPIPPATAPAIVTAVSTGTPLPLQARPVTPRPADGQTDADTTRTRTGASPRVADDPHAGMAKVTPTAAEPHQATLGIASAQAPGQVGAQPHGLAPLQAQGPREVSGLPPLQGQGPTREAAQGSVRAVAPSPGLGRLADSGNAQAPAQMALRPTELRAAENRLNESPREPRTTEPPPTQRQALEPRGPGNQFGRQGQTEQAQMAPAPGGSLLGMSRSSVPLPLPAPTPVNANWSGPGSPGSGR